MKGRTVRYVLGQGLVGLWRNRTMSMASIGTVTATLIILGLIITLVLNISNLADLVQMQFDEIQVYLEDDLSIEEINNVGKQIEAKEKVEDKQDIMGDRINVMYRNGNIGYAEVLLNSKSVTELMTNLDMVKRIVKHDVELLKELKEQRDIINNWLVKRVYV
jgi:cell division transport system permease protein